MSEKKTVVLALKEGYCPKCGDPIYALKLIKRGKGYFVYAEHFDGEHRTLHYLGPAHKYKYVLNNLHVLKWLAKKGFIPLREYLDSYKRVLSYLSGEELIKFSDIKKEIFEIIKKKASKEDLEEIKKMLS